jgi:hypothetical protein
MAKTKDKWLKTGPLSSDEQEFIRSNFRIISIDEMAERLKRKVNSVEKFCIKNNFKYTRLSKNFNDINDSPEVAVLKQKLRNKTYYTEIRSQLSQDELKYFEDRWVEIVMQFNEDILPTEEMQIKQMLTLDILMNRLMKEQKKYTDDITVLEVTLQSYYSDKGMLSDNVNLISGYEEQLANARNSLGSYNQQYKILLEKFRDIMASLKGTREQRIKVIEESKKNWTGLLKYLEEEDNKLYTGKHMELMKDLTNKTREEYFQYHEYADQSVCPPIMTPESVLLNDKLDAEATKIKEETTQQQA